MESKKKVTGIGGVFFRTEDPQKLKKWYQENLGLKTDEYGASFIARQWEKPEKSHYLQWSVIGKESKNLEPSTKPFMINYRVEDLVWLVGELKKAGVTICDEIETYDYGKFVHIMDPEGNKIELWEPIDEEFDKYYKEDSTRERNF